MANWRGAAHRMNCDTPPLLGNCKETCGSYGERSWHLMDSMLRGSMRKPVGLGVRRLLQEAWGDGAAR